MRGTINVKIGGEDRPIYFGTNQGRIYCELRGVTLKQMQEELNRIAIVKEVDGKTVVESEANGGELVDLVYSALKAGAQYHDQPFDFTNTKVGFWLDELEDETDFYKSFYSFMLSLNSSGEKPADESEDQSKKK